MAVPTPALGLSGEGPEQQLVGVFRRGDLDVPQDRVVMIDRLVDAANRFET